MKRKTQPVDPRVLDALIDAATVDAHDLSEQAMGLFCCLEENLALPFTTDVLGHAVIVKSIEQTDDNRIVAVCQRARHQQRLDLADLPLPRPSPQGAEWIAAYRRWLGNL